jgi:hypothetical protein
VCHGGGGGVLDRWGLQPSADRVLLCRACRSQKHKWHKLQMTVSIGASYNRLHKDQAVVMVQSRVRSVLCRRRRGRRARREAPMIQRVLAACS